MLDRFRDKPPLANASLYWHIVVNPHAGPAGRAHELGKRLQRMLSECDIQSVMHETQSTDDGARIARLTLKNSDYPLDALVMAVVGGDGTLHDLIKGIMGLEGEATTRGAHLVLVPAGTANAAYHSFFPETCKDPNDLDPFLSVKAALKLPNPGSGLSLSPLAVCKISTGALTPPRYSHVVTSTCLHAHILETASTSEMRAKFPGVERFRKAAEQHIGEPYSANVTLLPIADGSNTVQRWSHKSQQWESVNSKNASPVKLEGEFVYFVSSLVDRFEAAFRIAPLSSSKRRPAGAVDVLLVRNKTGASRQVNADRLMHVLMSAYKDGEHIYLTEKGDDTLEVNGDGDAVVEYYRTGGFQWQPTNEAARLVCIDGATSMLTPGQSLTSEVIIGGGSGVEASPLALFC